MIWAEFQYAIDHANEDNDPRRGCARLAFVFAVALGGALLARWLS